MIWFHFDCIMQLKKSYYIATNVGSRKSATTFGDLPDCLVGKKLAGHPDVVGAPPVGAAPTTSSLST